MNAKAGMLILILAVFTPLYWRFLEGLLFWKRGEPLHEKLGIYLPTWCMFAVGAYGLIFRGS
jgi:hypothetical protein